MLSMNKSGILFFIMLCCAAFCNKVIGQGINNNQSLQRVADNMVIAYQTDIGKQSRLYRGPEFEFYDIQSIGNPYFRDSLTFVKGSVKYDGIVYKNTPLLYDEYKQLLISFLYNNYTKYSFLSDLIDEFDLSGHHFIRFIPDELNKKMEIGFYDELYNNKTRFLVRRIKTRQEEGTTAKRIFLPTPIYYLKKGAIYYSVSSKGDVFDLLADKKKELKQYLKDSHINFKENRELAILKLATY